MNINKILLLCGGCGLLNCLNVNAQRPIIQTKYTADPAPMVYNDTVFLIRRMMKMMPKGLKCRIGCCILLPIWLTGLIMGLLLLSRALIG